MGDFSPIADARVSGHKPSRRSLGYGKDNLLMQVIVG